MKIITIGNLKGGVGKTTTAVNLGYSMSFLGKRVLLVDADPQANLTPFFTKANLRGNTIKNLFQNPLKISKTICRSKYKGIDIIKGCTQLKESDVIGTEGLREALCSVSQKYDICIIDTRPAFETLTQNALYASDILLTPVLLDKFCRDNLLLVEDSLHSLDISDGFKWGIFANKVENKRVQRNTYADMVEKHDWSFMNTCISKGAVVENALELYKPVMKHRSKSIVAADYLDLAQELLEEM